MHIITETTLITYHLSPITYHLSPIKYCNKYMNNIIILAIILYILILVYSIKKEGFNVSINNNDCKVNTSNRNYNRCCIVDADRNQFKQSLSKYVNHNTLKIPKIIHQIWIGKNKMPVKWINTFRIDFLKNHPDWKYYLWTDDNIDQIINTMSDAYKQCYHMDKSYHGRADILRYQILDNYGGIYIDADSIWLNNKDLTELIEKTNKYGMFIAQECKDCGKINYANGVIGCSKGNPLIKYIIQTLSTSYPKCKNMSPAYKTGPYLMDQTIGDIPITVFPYYYFYPVYWLGNKKKTELDEKDLKNFPDSFMYQFGYTTNALGTEF